MIKASALIILLTSLHVSANVYSQNLKLSLQMTDKPLMEVIRAIEKQSEYRFFFSDNYQDLNAPVTISAKDEGIADVMKHLLDNKNVTYKLLENNIVVITPVKQIKITGTVIDKTDGKPMPGVNILVSGTTITTRTGLDGRYEITVPSDHELLEFSFIGYLTEKVSVIGKTTINVSLAPDVKELQEVVVVGYGTQAKKDILGSVSVVDMNSLKSVPSASAELALQGQAAGVNIITSGIPGGGTNIFIRGISSFGNTQPLVVIDGVQGSLHDINANDIESMQVLKDAGAASIYGVRGSNGVILVTTKKGKSGSPKISYDGYLGVQSPPGGNVFNLMNTREYSQMAMQISPGVLFANGIPDYLYRGVLNGAEVSGAAKEGNPFVDPSKYVFDPTDPSKDYLIQKVNQEGTDWFHELFKDAPMQVHSLTASGGTDNANYLFSLGYLNQQGTLIKTYLKRYSLRVNTQYSINKNIRVGENLYGFYRDNPGFTNQSENNPISFTYRTMRLIPVYDIAGNYGGTYAGVELNNGTNPVAVMERTRNNMNNAWDITGNVYGEFDFLKSFTFRTSFGGTIDSQHSLNYSFNTYNERETHNSVNQLGESSQYNHSWTWTNTLTFNKAVGMHNIKVIAGSEAIKNTGRGVGGSASDFLLDDPEYLILNNGTQGITNFSNAYAEDLFSLFARADYSFKDQYLFGSTVRRDGSSRFGSKKRYGVFPSFSLGWRISSAEFMKNISWINDMKLRGSWGKMGSQNNIGYNNAYTLYNAGFGSSYYDIDGNNNIVRGFYPSSYGNPNTSWEEDVVTNIGLDLSILKNRLRLSAEWYQKSINGLLFSQPLPSTAGGAASPTINIGDIENKGFDFLATYHGRGSGSLKYDIGLNVTTYANKVTKLPNPGYFDAGGTAIGAIVRNQVGYPASSFYGYEVNGLFRDADDVANSATQAGAAPGRFKYRDVNGDGAITDKDRTFYGDPNPDFTYGLNLNGSYKQFDFSMILYGSQGNDVFNYVRYFTDFWGSPSGSKSRVLLDAWTPENLDATTPIAESSNTFSTSGVINSYYKEDGSFLKCRSLALGYTLKPSVLKRAAINRLRIYGQVANLFTITKYKGIDPELTGSSAAFGIDAGNYPSNQKNFIIGVNLTL